MVPVSAEIEELVKAASDLLRASISDYGLDDDDTDDESVAAGLGAEPHGRPWQSAVKFGHMRRLQDAIARLSAFSVPAEEVVTDAMVEVRDIDWNALREVANATPAETRPVVPEEVWLGLEDLRAMNYKVTEDVHHWDNFERCCTDFVRKLLVTPQPAPSVAAFQARNGAWMDRVMHDDPTDIAERRSRFGEEALELQQALGQTRDEAIALVEYVHGRAVGEPFQEMGGVMTTLACLATSADIDMLDAGEVELARINTPAMMAKIREKRSKRHGRGPLPGIYEPDFMPSTPQPAPEAGHAPQKPATSGASAWQSMSTAPCDGTHILAVVIDPGDDDMGTPDVEMIEEVWWDNIRRPFGESMPWRSGGIGPDGRRGCQSRGSGLVLCWMPIPSKDRLTRRQAERAALAATPSASKGDA